MRRREDVELEPEKKIDASMIGRVTIDLDKNRVTYFADKESKTCRLTDDHRILVDLLVKRGQVRLDNITIKEKCAG